MQYLYDKTVCVPYVGSLSNLKVTLQYKNELIMTKEDERWLKEAVSAAVCREI